MLVKKTRNQCVDVSPNLECGARRRYDTHHTHTHTHTLSHTHMSTHTRSHSSPHGVNMHASKYALNTLLNSHTPSTHSRTHPQPRALSCRESLLVCVACAGLFRCWFLRRDRKLSLFLDSLGTPRLEGRVCAASSSSTEEWRSILAGSPNLCCEYAKFSAACSTEQK